MKEDTFINHTKQEFTIIENEIIDEKDLSLEAKGLFLYFASKPDDWKFSLEEILSENKISRKKLLRIIKELEKKDRGTK